MSKKSLQRILALAAIGLGAAVATASLATFSVRRTQRVLVNQLRSEDDAVAREAFTDLLARGFFHDGNADLERLARVKLRGADLSGAQLIGVSLNSSDLRGADLGRVYLAGTDMHEVDLTGATGLTDASLAQLDALWGATMPDGSRYDGRYDLPGDLENARAESVDMGDAGVLAGWYGVSLAVYKEGQAWAEAHLEEAWAAGRQSELPVSRRVEPGALAVLAAVPLAVILVALGWLGSSGKGAGSGRFESSS